MDYYENCTEVYVQKAEAVFAKDIKENNYRLPIEIIKKYRIHPDLA